MSCIQNFILQKILTLIIIYINFNYLFFSLFYKLFYSFNGLIFITRYLCIKILTGSRPEALIKGLGGCSFLHFNLAIPSVPLHDANAAPKTDMPLNILLPDNK